jgi:ribosomal protein S18 acetylase RimI-like enzyme
MTANTTVLEVEEPSLTPAPTPEPIATNVIALPRREVIRIRSYTPADRQTIQHLCCETGYFGGPVDALFHDRELFADLFTKVYLDYESEWGLVAEADGRVIGYLLGSISPNFDRLQMRSGFETTMKMLFRLASGKYSNHPRSRRFIRWLLFSGYLEQPKHPQNAAHLHYDLDKKYRGRGLGRRLWQEFVSRAKSAGVKTCYGSFFSSSQRRPEVAYARFGFEVFDRRRTTMFEPEILEPVEVVCVAKDI